MEYDEFEKIFNEECRKNNITDIKNIHKFYQYMKILLEWNKKINLTSINEEREFLVKHFIDSLTVSKFIDNSNKIIDVGTGAGFPGIPLKLFHEEQSVTLLDSVGKKINVLKNVIDRLELRDIEAIHARAEELAQKMEYREKYDVAVSRAVSNMTTLVEYLMPFVKVGGIVICMKGPNFEEELEASRKAINVLRGTIEKVVSFNIDEELERNVIIIRKTDETPSNYPRGQGKPLKDPIR